MQIAEQIQAFNFGGDTIDVVLRADGELFVSVRRVCKNLGILSEVQIEKIRTKPWAVFDEFRAPSQPISIPSTLEYQQMNSMFMLHIESFPMWLATINTSKIAFEAQPKLIAYQKAAARVLADHFLGRRSNQALPSEFRVPVSLAFGGVTVRLVAFPDQPFMWLNFRDFSAVLGVPNMDIGSLRSVLGTQHRYIAGGAALEPMWAAKLLVHSRTPAAATARHALGIDACPKRARLDLAVERMLHRNPDAPTTAPSYEQPPTLPPQPPTLPRAGSSDAQLEAFGALLSALHIASVGIITMTKLKDLYFASPQLDIQKHCDTLGFFDGGKWQNKRVSSTLGAYQGRNLDGYALRPVVPYSKWTVEVVTSPAGQT